ncbi:MAG: DJ-1/PfpI family protein [Halobacteria archaeon]|nr:DJ-1/PfpI family protein [Halobacteria archaeon]
MEVGFIIYEGMTTLDFLGVYDPVTRLNTMGFMDDLNWDVCAYTEEVRDITGLEIKPTEIREPLSKYDLVVVPGGFSSEEWIEKEGFIDWIRTSEECDLKASVCTGSLILGEAGYLKDKKATTHPNAFEGLKKYCASVVDDRIVDEGNVITARGVTSSIDLGLYLCEKITDRETKEKIRKQMDYMPETTPNP